MGHRSNAPGVEGRYDRPELEDVLAEQAQKLDRGPLGMVLASPMERVPDSARELLDLFERLGKGSIQPSEFLDRALALSHRTTVFVR
jgi:hypothetical protein